MKLTLCSYAKSLLDEYYSDYRTHAPLPPDILILCVSYNCKIKRKYHKMSGKLHYINKLYCGKTHGLYEEYYDNGNPSAKCFFRYGLVHGIYEEWYMYPRNQYSSVTNWNNGSYDGLQEQWYQNGGRKARKIWENGFLIILETWHENGVRHKLYNRYTKLNYVWDDEGLLTNDYY